MGPFDQLQGDIQKDEALYGRRQGDLVGRQEQIAADREKTLAPMEQKLSQDIAQPLPERPKTQLPEFKPQPLIPAKDYESLSYGLIAMAMIGGVASKGNWLGVGDALNGALKGYLQGNQMEAEKRYEDYKREYQSAKGKEEQANREFEDILSNKKLRISEMIQQYRLVSAKYDRQDAVVASQSKSLDAMWRSLESRKTALARLEEQHSRATEALELRRQLAGKKDGTAGISERYNADPEYKKNVDYWAKYLQQGNSLPPRFAQSGAGKIMMPDILNVVPTLGGGNPADMAANKITLRQMNAEAQKLGTQSASVAIANKELQRFIPLAEQAIDAVPRTAWKPVNQLIQAGENTWSPEQKRLMIANRSVLNAFAQLIQRGAPTVHSLTEAENLLSTADSPAVYKAAMTQLRQEGVQADLGLKDAYNDLQERVKSMGSESAPAQKNQPSLTNSKGWTLHEDASGNKAYVGPKGEVEEVH